MLAEEENVKFSGVMNGQMDACYKGLVGKIEFRSQGSGGREGRALLETDFERGEINIILRYQKLSKVSDTPPQ